MKNTSKNLLYAILFTMVLMARLLLGDTESVEASEVVAEGEWGPNIIWVLDDEGTLTFSGTGKMVEGVTYSDGEVQDVPVYPWTTYVNEIKTVVVKKGITDVPSGAFAACNNHEEPEEYENLTTVRLGSGVKSIGVSAFSACPNLKKVVMPKGLTTISERAFNSCKSLTDIKLPEKLTTIGKYAFGGCISLTDVTIPAKVKTIKEYAFSTCTKLSNLTFEKNTNKELKLGYQAFYKCKSLKKVALPDNIKKLDYTFMYCTSLEKITLPKNLTTLRGAFSNCSKLKKVTIPSTVTSLDGKVFYKCKSLKTIVIKTTKIKLTDSTMRDAIFDGIPAKATIILPESKYHEYKEAMRYFVPETIKFESSSGKVPKAPSYAKDKIIADGTWGSNIKWKLEENGTLTFSGKGKMINGYPWALAKYYGKEERYPWAQYAPYIKTAVFKNGITNVPDNVFGAKYLNTGASEFSKLTKVKLGSTVKTIGYKAFTNCRNLKSVTFPKKLTTIDHYAFYGCEKLAKVTLGTKLSKVGYDVFVGVSPKVKFTFPSAQYKKYKKMIEHNAPETATYKKK